VITYTRK